LRRLGNTRVYCGDPRPEWPRQRQNMPYATGDINTAATFADFGNRLSRRAVVFRRQYGATALSSSVNTAPVANHTAAIAAYPRAVIAGLSLRQYAGKKRKAGNGRNCRKFGRSDRSERTRRTGSRRF